MKYSGNLHFLKNNSEHKSYNLYTSKIFIGFVFLENATIYCSTIYGNSSDEFDIELHWIKVKVTVGV